MALPKTPPGQTNGFPGFGAEMSPLKPLRLPALLFFVLDVQRQICPCLSGRYRRISVKKASELEYIH